MEAICRHDGREGEVHFVIILDNKWVATTAGNYAAGKCSLDGLEHQDLWRRLGAAMDKLCSAVKVDVEWTPGHTSVEDVLAGKVTATQRCLNNGADLMAKQGARAHRPTARLIEKKKYRKELAMDVQRYIADAAVVRRKLDGELFQKMRTELKEDSTVEVASKKQKIDPHDLRIRFKAYPWDGASEGGSSPWRGLTCPSLKWQEEAKPEVVFWYWSTLQWQTQRSVADFIGGGHRAYEGTSWHELCIDFILSTGLTPKGMGSGPQVLSSVTATFMVMTRRLEKSLGVASFAGECKELGILTPFGLRHMVEGTSRRACLKTGDEVGFVLARLCDAKDQGTILKVALDKGLRGSKAVRTWTPHRLHFERLFAGAAAGHRPAGQQSLGRWALGA